MQHPAYSQLRPVTDSAAVVLCTNPSYAALEGTNSWIVRREGDERAIVVDPGPEDEGHLNVLHAKAGEVALILLTHRHPDHADGAHRFRQLTGAPVRAFDARYCHGADPLTDGETVSVDGVTPQLEVVHTPGHTADCACFFVWSGKPGESTLEGVITGDTIAGRHTTMISETDGDLGDYMQTLEMLECRGKDVALLPGHGPDNPDLSQFARKYIDRRNYRLDQIRKIWKERGRDLEIDELVNLMYDDVDPVLRGAAEQSTRVALRYLNDHPEQV
ncbi:MULTISPECIES: MBL fold metallo-hydrolase [Corynebacterium]|uniref:MBL fold metallo-hydrolase n=1 Tax=Corynebacterium TaxID=1716 RepID=UPI00254C67AD|nr:MULTISPECIES: MBL fold metallo-hydrolase [Corynebacterium]MDK6260183.1 MBL fold metallo-hydrolase [Corynebacterium frankenforstense]MDK8895977.1 MBL fold metallo-hydrolase [Corynebacterium sp. MSK006]